MMMGFDDYLGFKMDGESQIFINLEGIRHDAYLGLVNFGMALGHSRLADE
jgi:hypothetical protein